MIVEQNPEILTAFQRWYYHHQLLRGCGSSWKAWRKKRASRTPRKWEPFHVLKHVCCLTGRQVGCSLTGCIRKNSTLPLFHWWFENRWLGATTPLFMKLYHWNSLKFYSNITMIWWYDIIWYHYYTYIHHVLFFVVEYMLCHVYSFQKLWFASRFYTKTPNEVRCALKLWRNWPQQAWRVISMIFIATPDMNDE